MFRFLYDTHSHRLPTLFCYQNFRCFDKLSHNNAIYSFNFCNKHTITVVKRERNLRNRKVENDSPKKTAQPPKCLLKFRDTRYLFCDEFIKNSYNFALTFHLSRLFSLNTGFNEEIYVWNQSIQNSLSFFKFHFLISWAVKRPMNCTLGREVLIVVTGITFWWFLHCEIESKVISLKISVHKAFKVEKNT